MIRDIEIVVERDKEGYYVATVPSLKGCHTQAKSYDELMERVEEAIELCLLARAIEDGEGTEIVDRDEVFRSFE